MIAWILGIVFLLIISLFICDETVEPFIPPTVIPTKVRSDLTCSDPESSVIFDRFDKSGMESLGKNLEIPERIRNNALDDGAEFYSGSIEFGQKRIELQQICNGSTDTTDPDYKKKKGNKIFIETDINNSEIDRTYNGTYKLVDLFCCKGEMYQPAGSFDLNSRVCLPECPSNYTKNSFDSTICIRNDSTCTYTADLSANIQNNWSKTCAALYKQNINIISTINSISTVVSTFSIQTSTVQSNYSDLYSQLSRYNSLNEGSSDNNVNYNRNNYINNFGDLSNSYSNLYSNIQSNISERYNTLQADKVKFDTLFNNLGCSNYM